MKPEVEALVLKARETYDAAQLLLEHGYRDSAASRAYYAMFHAAQALLLDCGLAYSSHSAVIAAFGREIARPGLMEARFHRYLIDAQDVRNAADYAIEPALDDARVRTLLSHCQEFLDAAERVLSTGEE
jgi:uncharacterized protein (UPF0332 family)